MNPTAPLALIAYLYGQVTALRGANVQLRKAQTVEPRQPTPGVVLEDDGYKVYGPHAHGGYSVSWDAQWLSGVYSKTPEDALELGRAEVAKG